MKWGFDKSQLNKTTFFLTEHSLSVAGLSQHKTLVYYDKNLQKDRNFGGVRINGLISHAWLKNYTWTINFDEYEYIFGVME